MDIKKDIEKLVCRLVKDGMTGEEISWMLILL